MGGRGAALLLVDDGADASAWPQLVAGYGHAAPLSRLYVFFEVRLLREAELADLRTRAAACPPRRRAPGSATRRPCA
jgi:hypothetical protein